MTLWQITNRNVHRMPRGRRPSATGSRRRGAVMIELVVMTIVVGVVASVLLPLLGAVRKAQEAARFEHYALMELNNIDEQLRAMPVQREDVLLAAVTELAPRRLVRSPLPGCHPDDQPRAGCQHPGRAIAVASADHDCGLGHDAVNRAETNECRRMETRDARGDTMNSTVRRLKTSPCEVQPSRRGAVFNYYMMYLFLTGMVMSTAGISLHIVLRSSTADDAAEQRLQALVRLEHQLRQDQRCLPQFRR